jgi:enoyl-CoA hydratase
MWTYRIGPEKAKMMLFTGKLIDGIEAEKIGLVSTVCKQKELD